MKYVRLMSSRFFVCLLPCAFPLSAFAAHPLSSEDTGVQGAGNWQLEFNSDRVRQRDTHNSDIAVNATLTRGLSDSLDLAINGAWLRLQSGDDPRETQRGWGDSAIFLKWRAWEAGKYSFALKPQLNIPTGDHAKGIGSDRYQPSLTSVGAWGDDQLMVLANLGYQYADNADGQRKDIWSVSTAVQFWVTEKLRLVSELGTYTNYDPTSKKYPAFANVGLIYSPTDKLDLDIGYRHGLNRAEALYQFGGGVTVRW
jgi:hypothetical protein